MNFAPIKKRKEKKKEITQYNQKTKPIEPMIVTYCESQIKYTLWINNLQNYVQYAQQEFNRSANKALDPPVQEIR